MNPDKKRHFIWRSIFLLILSVFSVQTSTAAAYLPDMDTIPVKAGTVIKINGKLIIPRVDTIMILPDSIIRNNPSLRSAQTYNKWKEQSGKAKFSRELSRMIFSSHRIPSETDNSEAQSRAAEFSVFSGKTVRNIKIRHFGVFGINLHDTAYSYANSVEKFLNRSHINTKSWVILKSLLFSEGDVIDAPLLAENERYIRTLSYIEDARFLVIPDTLNPEIADLWLLVKDVYPWAGSVHMRSIDKTDMGVWNNNMLGIGHRFDVGMSYRTDHAPAFRFRTTGYSVRNIAGSLVNGQIYYLIDETHENSGISLIRELIPGKNNYLYGLSLNRYNQEYPMIFQDTTFSARIGSIEWWANFGKVLQLKPGSGLSANTSQLQLQGTVTNRLINSVAEELQSRSISYYNNTRYLLSIAWSQSEVISGNYFEGFGKTEDISTGFLYKVTGGIETGDQGRQFYGITRLARVVYLRNKGFASMEGSLSGNISGTRFKNGILNLNLSYFSPLTNFGAFHKRELISISYIKGYERFENENLLLDGETGLVQFGSVDIKGQERVTLSLASHLYTPWYIIGFGINMFVKMEAGLLPETGKNLLESALYPGFGLGIRLKNENLAFDTFRISLIYYPNSPDVENYHLYSGKYLKFRFADLYDYSVRETEFR